MTIQKSVIPAEKSEKFDAWQIPEVKDGQVIKTEKLRDRGPRGELVNVDKSEVIYNSISAGQLEEIANQAYEEVYEQAYKEGHKKGYAQGHKEGLEAGQQTIKQQSEALNMAIEQLYSYLGERDDEIEQALVNLATCVSQAVLRRELITDSSYIQDVVSEAIATLPMNPGNIQIFLSEQDYQQLKTLTTISEQWLLHIDPNLTPGGCHVTTSHSVVDYTLEEQFQQTVNSIVEKRFGQLAVQAKPNAKPELG